MAKVVYNAVHGGFSLSEAAMRRYAEIKGLNLYVERERTRFATYYTVPPEARTAEPSAAEWLKLPLETRQKLNAAWDAEQLSNRDFYRTDPVLVQVVEELGPAANGACADLRIAEVPSGTRYRIDDYDGRESVMTVDDYEWSVAP